MNNGFYRYLFFCLLLKSSFGFSQVQLSVIPTFDGEPLELEKKYSLSGNDSVQFETLKFYLSNISYTDNSGKTSDLTKKYFLIDLERPTSQLIQIPSTVGLSQITFDLGIDSLTNVSGAMEGALDPTNGMYWTWQSGYINVKIEGTSSLCSGRNHYFQYHLGGYQYPNYALQTIQLDFTGNDHELRLPIDDFLKAVNSAETCEVMRPCEKAIELSEMLSTVFTTDR